MPIRTDEPNLAQSICQSLRWLIGVVLCIFPLIGSEILAQPPESSQGDVIPRDVREMYDRGLEFLAKSQDENGDGVKGASRWWHHRFWL